jgi:uncharacterized protein YjbI with pentapeptide repeats
MTIAKVSNKVILEPTSFDKETVMLFLKQCAQHDQLDKWNDFRKKHLLKSFDLNNADLSGLNLTMANLSNCELNFANFSEAKAASIDLSVTKLKGANFHDSDLTEANFSNCDATGADFENSIMILANATHADFTGAKFAQSDLSATNFKSSTLKGAQFEDAKLKATIFSNCDLRVANMVGVNFHETLFDSVTLTGADLSRADLSGIDLTRVDFQGIILKGANLNNTNLEALDLKGVSFEATKLNSANLVGADISEANLTSASLMGADLSNVIARNSDFTLANLEGAYCKGAEFEDAVFEDAVLEDADMRVANFSNAIMLGADTTNTLFTGSNLEGTGMQVREEVEPELESALDRLVSAEAEEVEIAVATQDEQIDEVKHILDDIDGMIEEEVVESTTQESEPVKESSVSVTQSQEREEVGHNDPIAELEIDNESYDLISDTAEESVSYEQGHKLESTTLEEIIATADELDELTSKEEVSAMLKNISYVVEYNNSNLNGKFTEPFLQMARAYQEATYLSYLGFIGKQEEILRLNKSEREAFRLEFDIQANRIIISISENIAMFIDDMYDTYESDRAINTIFSVFMISGYMSIKEVHDYISEMEESHLKDIFSAQLQRYKLSRAKNEKLKALLSPVSIDSEIVLKAGNRRFTAKDYINLKNHSVRKEQIKIEGEFLIDGASGLSTSQPTFYLLNDGVSYEIMLNNSPEDKLKAAELLKRLQKSVFTSIVIEKVDGEIQHQKIGDIEIW